MSESTSGSSAPSSASSTLVSRASVLRPGRYAAIDIGTVTCRMLVADIDEMGNVNELTCEYAITNLGEGVDATGLLKSDAIDRVAAVLSGFIDIRDSFSTADHPVLETIAVATSASRDARNAGEFVSALRRIGIELAVIPGEKEAGLSFAGASCDFTGQTLMVVDIGGGSTEVVVGKAAERPRWTHSFNVGCRRVTERFLLADPPSEGELHQARSWIREEMEGLLAEAEESVDGSYELVAVAGTATTVVTVRDAVAVYDSALVHKQRVTRKELDDQFEMLRAMPNDQRAKVVGLDPGRAPVIVAGLMIMQVVMDLAGADSFVVSETDILHGMVLDAASMRD